MRKRKYAIPEEDYPLIEELLHTLELHEVAKKWDVISLTMSRYLKRHNTSALKIKDEHRNKVYQAERAKGTTQLEIAKILNLAPSNLRVAIKRYNQTI